MRPTADTLPRNTRVSTRPIPRPLPTVLVAIDGAVALPRRRDLERHARRWIMRELTGWIQLAVLERLADGSVEWDPQVLVDGPRWSGSGGRQLVAVRCVDRRGPRRPGFWAALATAQALASLVGGTIVDSLRGGRAPIEALRPPADGRVRAIDHLRIPSSNGSRTRCWLSTVGMGAFGLPNLELVDVPRAWTEVGARLLLGVAQHMIDAGWVPPRPGAGPREALLTLGELYWALGGRADTRPSSRGRGWTRVALEVPGERLWPGLIRVAPPIGARGWQSNGAWLRDAWSDLIGAPQKSSRARVDNPPTMH